MDKHKLDPPTPIECVLKTGLRTDKNDASGIRLLMPLQGNTNHIGTMYAGALFTLAEIMGGTVYRTYMKTPEVFPIVKSLNIKFLKPARSDIFAEYKMEQDIADKILKECLDKGKANYDILLELKDESGQVVSKSEGFYQIRKGKTL